MKNQRPIILLVVLIIVIVLAVGALWWIKSQGENGGVNTNANTNINANTNVNTVTVPIANIFNNKVVYGIGLSQDLLPLLKQDCQQRGGTFQECGSPCGSNEQYCIAVCAFTCELKTQVNTNTSIPSSKSCDQDSDCGLLLCGGCFSKEYLKTAPADLPCTTYDGYTCQCVKNRCVEIKPDKPYNFYSIKNETDCLALGAEWVSVGKMMRCEIPAPDAGKTCTKASDCIRYCSQKNVNDATGTCSAHSGTSCYRFLDEDGKFGMICVD